MKTDDLIRALASDGVAEAASVRGTAAWAVPVAALAVGAAFLLTLGLRADIAAGSVLAATAMKLAVTLTLAATGVFLALRFARSTEFGVRIPLVLAIAPLLLALFVFGDLARAGVPGWSARMIGTNGLFCLTMAPLLSLPPLAGLLHVLRAGAVTRPAFAGFVAGLAATGIGASFYALHCTDDSPLFLALWYGLTALIVGGAGAAAGKMFVRW